jgi:hypothetical protein
MPTPIRVTNAPNSHRGIRVALSVGLRLSLGVLIERPGELKNDEKFIQLHDEEKFRICAKTRIEEL